MAQVKFFKILNSQLNSLAKKEGQVIFVTDTGKLYMDSDNNTRVEMKGSSGESEEDLGIKVFFCDANSSYDKLVAAFEEGYYLVFVMGNISNNYVEYWPLTLYQNSIFYFEHIYQAAGTSPTSIIYYTASKNGFNLESVTIPFSPITSTITLSTSNWTQNSKTKNYEYKVSNSNVTSSTLVECYMDLANQAKMTDGYTESYSGYYNIITSEKPVEDITMTVKIQKM